MGPSFRWDDGSGTTAPQVRLHAGPGIAAPESAVCETCVKSEAPGEHGIPHSPRTRSMDNDFLIPLLVTLITAMAIGAIYLLMLLMNDGQPESNEEESLADYVADQAAAPAEQAGSDADASEAAAPAEPQQT